ncbi:MAG TPA: ABC transporter permease [Acidobacteriota bacterium]|nr:ABC transporter permease [Acidobacteriota bacterium]
MSTLVQDVRFAVRTLRKGWMITALAVASLALAIAGNSIVFSLTNGLLFRPLPFAEPGSLMLLWLNQESQAPPANFTLLSEAELLDYRERTRSLALLDGRRNGRINWTQGESPQPLAAELVTDGLFQVLGGNPLHGRAIQPGDAGEKVVLLHYRFWQERLGADPSVVGDTLDLNSEPYTILGVMPPDFEIFTPGVKLWLPLKLDPEARRSRNLMVLGRLAPDVTLEQARAEIDIISADLKEAYPDSNRGHSAVLEPYQDRFPDAQNRLLMGMLQAALLFVLLIACANVANLLLARGSERQREFAVRRALGAGRLRILRQLFSESLFLSLASGAVGLAVAYVGIHFMHAAMAPMMPSFMAPVLDANVLLYTVGVTLAAGLFFGTAPALQGSKVSLSETLREGGHGASAGSRRRLLSKGLVVAEITLSAVLLAGAVMLVQGFNAIQNRDSGFDTSQLLTVRVTLPPDRYEQEGATRFFQEAAQGFSRLPGVQGVTASSTLPRSFFVPGVPFTTPELSLPEGEPPPSAITVTVLPSYFETLGVPLLSGRALQETDRAESQPVALVSRALAERWFQGRQAIGTQIKVAGGERQIVGVVDNVLHSIMQSGTGGQPAIYLPAAQQARRSMAFMLRTEGRTAGLGQGVRSHVESLDRDASIGSMLSLDAFAAQFLTIANVISLIMGGFGIVALALAAVGIYGVLAYSVVQRRHEIGVRMALGAGKGRILGLITRQGLTLTVIGLVLAAPGVVLVYYGISSALAGMAKADAGGLVGVALVLAAVAAAACYLPARRAAGFDPIHSLRSE